MSKVTPEIVEQFATLCDDAYAAWIVRRGLFDDNAWLRDADTTFIMYGLAALDRITMEHALLQIAKLHDPAKHSGNENLSLNFLLSYGNWDAGVSAQLMKHCAVLDAFYGQIKSARNKLVAHNDLKALRSGAARGAFSEGADREYFQHLQSFLNTIHEAVVGGPRLFFDLLRSDISILGRRMCQRGDA